MKYMKHGMYTYVYMKHVKTRKFGPGWQKWRDFQQFQGNNLKFRHQSIFDYAGGSQLPENWLNVIIKALKDIKGVWISVFLILVDTLPLYNVVAIVVNGLWLDWPEFYVPS